MYHQFKLILVVTLSGYMCVLHTQILYIPIHKGTNKGIKVQLHQSQALFVLFLKTNTCRHSKILAQQQ